MSTSGYIYGLQSSSSGGDTLTIQSGTARDSTDSEWIQVPTGETRGVDLTGSGAGGLDTGSVQADTSYAVYVIKGSGGAVAGIASTSFSASGVTKPAGAKLRRIGAIVTDSSKKILAFITVGSSSDRTVTYQVPLAKLKFVDADGATTWTAGFPGSLIPETATEGKLYVVPSGVAGNVTSVKGDGPPVDCPVPTVLPLTPCVSNGRYDFKNSASGGLTDMYVLGFFDEL